MSDAGMSQTARRVMLGEVQSDLERRLEAMAQTQKDDRAAREAEALSAREALKSIGGDPEELEALRGEIAAAFPEVERVLYAPSVSDLSSPVDEGKIVPARVVFVSFGRGVSGAQRTRLRERVGSYLEERLRVEPVVVVDEPRVPVNARQK